MATKLTLKDSDVEVSIELAQENMTVHDLVNEAIVPLLLACGYSVENVNDILCDGCVGREDDDDELEDPPETIEDFLAELDAENEADAQWDAADPPPDEDDEYSIWYREAVPEASTCSITITDEDTQYTPTYNAAEEEE